MSLGLLVCEAATRSGSLITARLAAEMGRIVFAIPGSPLDPRAQGTNNLIKEGALLVTRPEDIAETLTPLSPSQDNRQVAMFSDIDENFTEFSQKPVLDESVIGRVDKDRDAVLNALSTAPIDLETLSLASEVPIDQIYLILVELDLAGKLIRHSGGMVSLAVTEFSD